MRCRIEAVFVLFAVVLFVFLVFRRRWSLAAARQAEVRRLVLLASEESARVEREANILKCSAGTSDAAVVRGTVTGRQCVVCCRPTTTRCARCKAVRYCSGKCQIIHWRQGHKEECCSPHADHDNGLLRVLGVNGLQTERPEGGDSLEIEGQSYSRPVEALFKRSGSSESNYSSEVFSEEDNLQNKPFVDTSGTESSSDSSTCSLFSSPIEASHDSSNIEIIARRELPASGSFFGSSPVRSGESLSGFSSTAREVTPCRNEEVEGASGVNLCRSMNYPNSMLSTECQDEIVDRSAAHASKVDYVTDKIFPKGGCIGVDVSPPLLMSSKLSDQVNPSCSISRNEHSFCKTTTLKEAALLQYRDTTGLGIEKSDRVSSGRNNHAQLQKSNGPTCPSSATHMDHRSHIFSEVDNSLKVPSGPSQIINYSRNGISDSKTSVRRVFEQIKAPKVSKESPSEPRIPRKESCKMLFPYDIFLKLYQTDVELCPRGLINCGNSCYANVVLQCLAFTRPLAAYLLEGLHMKTCPKKDWCFTCELGNLLLKAKQGKFPLSPISILSHLKNIGRNLGHGREEDAHEFLRYAVDAMQSACLKEAGPNVVGQMAEGTTLIQLIFGGYLRSKIRCMRCHGKSEQHERMMDLNVEIHGDVKTLEEALAHFTAAEILDGENKYYCNRCKSYERAKKKLKILEAPNVLTITLKRYQSGKFGKLNKAIRFPEHLNLAPYMRGAEDESPDYRLYGVVVHLDRMNAAFSGHYVCYVKNTQGIWYEVDDSMVKPVDLDIVLTKGAYMLLYARSFPRAPRMSMKAVSQDHNSVKKSTYVEDVSSNQLESHTSRRGSITKQHDNLAGDNGSRNYPHHHANFGSDGFFDERFRDLSVNSSSDNSSLLSCSDEGSWSTESTRNSFSTDDYCDYLFGESDHISHSNPWRFSEDLDGFAYSRSNLRNSSNICKSNSSSRGDQNKSSCAEMRAAGDGLDEYRKVHGRETNIPSSLYSNRTDHCREFTKQGRTRETNRINPNGGKSSSLLRRICKERIAQAFS